MSMFLVPDLVVRRILLLVCMCLVAGMVSCTSSLQIRQPKALGVE